MRWGNAHLNDAAGGGKARRRARWRNLARSRGGLRSLPRPRWLPAGNILFEKVGVLQADELDREAFLDMADDAARRLAHGYQRADFRPLVAPDRRARLGNV